MRTRIVAAVLAVLAAAAAALTLAVGPAQATYFDGQRSSFGRVHVDTYFDG